MKAKLILKHRGDYDYFLVSRTDNSEALEASLNPDGEFEEKLSKQNCDEIFGVVDVEKLAEESWSDKISSPYHAYIEGFNKAMELNKDKVFTLEDMGNLWDFCTYNKGTFAEFIQQLTEIEVEIGMELNMNGKNAIDRSMYIPKLDSKGCLILKKL
jgi:hypothetical protein